MLVLAILIGLLGIGPVVSDIGGGGPVGTAATANAVDDMNGSGPPG